MEEGQYAADCLRRQALAGQERPGEAVDFLRQDFPGELIPEEGFDVVLDVRAVLCAAGGLQAGAVGGQPSVAEAGHVRPLPGLCFLCSRFCLFDPFPGPVRLILCLLVCPAVAEAVEGPSAP